MFLLCDARLSFCAGQHQSEYDPTSLEPLNLD